MAELLAACLALHDRPALNLTHAIRSAMRAEHAAIGPFDPPHVAIANVEVREVADGGEKSAWLVHGSAFPRFQTRQQCNTPPIAPAFDRLVRFAFFHVPYANNPLPAGGDARTQSFPSPFLRVFASLRLSALSVIASTSGLLAPRVRGSGFRSSPLTSPASTGSGSSACPADPSSSRRRVFSTTSRPGSERAGPAPGSLRTQPRGPARRPRGFDRGR